MLCAQVVSRTFTSTDYPLHGNCAWHAIWKVFICTSAGLLGSTPPPEPVAAPRLYGALGTGTPLPRPAPRRHLHTAPAGPITGNMSTFPGHGTGNNRGSHSGCRWRIHVIFIRKHLGTKSLTQILKVKSLRGRKNGHSS